MDTVLYRADAPGNWGQMQAPAGGQTGEDQLVSPDNPSIYYRYWRIEGAPATLLWLHGLGAHSGWFIDVGNAIAARGLNFYALDHRGFGRSGGTRGHSSDWHLFLADIDRMVDRVRSDASGKPLFILGHSMGGIFAIHYTAAHQDKLTGMLLLNPWIADQTKLNLGVVFSILLGGMRGSQQLVHLPDTKSTAGMTDNSEAAKMLQSDPYWTYERTKGFYWQINQMRMQVLARARQITIPVFVMQASDDKAVVAAASRKAYDTMPSRDKTWKEYPDYEHDSEFEIDRSAMDGDIAAWIKEHAGT